ncbi:sulfhydryl oxidase 1-like protein [Leptotrombidium deliense]|uniref:Sulfhydryl oxidase 1-like protein n=1 Tax=Leptotrombidium deliense TaxID=299467 RepID=A0A443S2R3_9ACAR|nr:sulfhydryl oxidase 1-like protein [Leptotrombidium deliense]
MNFIFGHLLFALTLSTAFAFNMNRFYKNDDYPKTLTAANFDSYVYNRNSATLVEFYSSYCGYCKRLAPRYKLFATSVLNWKPVVRIAKVNCEELQNVDLCRAHKSISFPTFRYFGPNHQPEENGTYIPNMLEGSEFSLISSSHMIVENSDKLNTQLMQEMTIQQLMNTVSSKQPKGWPKLTTLFADNKVALFNEIKESHKPTFIVLELKNSKHDVGIKVQLDLSEHNDIIDTYHAKIDETLMNQLQEQASVLLIRVSNAKEQLYEVLKGWTPDEMNVKAVEFQHCMVSVVNNSYVKRKEHKEEQPLTMVDLYNALQHSLRHNIALRKTLTRRVAQKRYSSDEQLVE